ncbi:MAG: SnoaL-like domain-containing protein [Gemmatimonadales bacterium]|nr:SnoaL-like domain-containing protein [Gemmatimonadales bacterium]
MRGFATLVIAGLALGPSLAYAQTQTEQEVTQRILESAEYVTTNLMGETDNYSRHGALEFWSSGGLLNEIPPSGRPGEWDAINITPKHIKVIPLVEGQAAVALYYSEGMMKPKGSAGVSNYLTRVTQVFVKEDGQWKVRSSHWSAVTGGAGTTQTVLEN